MCSFAKDKNMQAAYEAKRDLYAEIASKCFHNDYASNLEFHPETGLLQPEGKERRSKAKAVFLGTCYGMGPKTLADRMNLPVAEAKKIIEDFFKGFPDVDRFMKESEAMAAKLGYVTDMFGRRRHLPDAALPEYEFSSIDGEGFEFNPLIDSVEHKDEKFERLINSFRDKLSKATWKADKDKIIAEATLKGISIRSNGGYIARAKRQTLNSRIQGTAASMTKLAMVLINEDEVLRDLGFKLTATIHDEVFGIAPIENAEQAGKRLCELMIQAAKTKCSFTPWSVDPYFVRSWYQDEVCGAILKEYKKCKDKPNAIEKVCDKFPMLNPAAIEKVINDDFDCMIDSLK